MRISDWSSDVCSSDLRRRNDLQAGELHAPVLDTLAVLSAEARSTAVADADHERAIDLPVGHITALGKFVRDIIIADGDEIREHDLRSEEHTSELQSLMRISYAVFCLKKKTEIKQPDKL